MRRWVWMGLTGALVVAGGGAGLVLHGRREPVRWRTARVDQGGITQRVTASGTLNALIQVPVGTQVSGVVTSLTADFSSLVKKGQIIGQIDPTPWLTALNAAQATLQSATDSKATAEHVYQRNLALWKAQLVDDNDLENFKLAMQVAGANLETARAGLRTAQTNLGYCTIKAPVDGVVVARLVDVGQTVAASFSTPSVFTIAQDLAHMKVTAAIDEADIGQVRVGQRAFFTVESYPDKQFRGQVSEVQLNPVITNNVVTYNVIMEVDNEARSTYLPGQGQGQGQDQDQDQGQAPDKAPARDRVKDQGPRARRGSERKASGPIAGGQLGTLEYTTARYMPPGSPVYNGNLALFPGMTADCSIVTNHREGVLRVPSAALRFNPAAFITLPEPHAEAASHALVATAGAGGQRAAGASQGSRGVVARREERLWILANGMPKAVPVKVGVSDGMYTEVSGDGIQAGLPVLVGAEDYKKAAAGAAMPGPLGGGGMRH